MLKLRWKVRVTNLHTDQEILIYVNSSSLNGARTDALRVAFRHLNWKKASACPVNEVEFAGLPSP